MAKRITYIKDYDGEWERLLLDDEIIHEGHSIPDFVWLELIEELVPGIEIDEVEVEQASWDES